MDHDFEAGSKALRQLIASTPVIDNHAHPLLKKSHIDRYPLLAIATEAHGDALDSSRTSLAHIRAVKQLSQELGCGETWEAIESAIDKERASETGYGRWTRRCLSGIECVLVDDGLDNEEAVESYRYFDRFVPSASKRIVRIEQVAAKLIEDACATQDTAEKAFEAAMTDFESALTAAIADGEVVGFKSVICYRTGLDMAPEEDRREAFSAFEGIFAQTRAQNATRTRFTRVDQRPLNQFLVHRLAQAIRDSDEEKKKPIQFHTGLGDNDLTLTRSSPAHLQDFVRQYPTVPIVLLHSGYPFDRETGYMAALYANVYADIGEVFPLVGRDGQENIVRHVLELCPWEKIIWSTDGHWFPETYLLSIGQMRDVFHTVLCEFVSKRDVSWSQASSMVEDMLFNTSNRLYNLGLTLRRRDDDDLTVQTKGNINMGADAAPSQARNLLRSLRAADAPHFIRLYWVDYTGTTRLRVIPSRRAFSLLNSGEPLTAGVTKAALGLLQNDTLTADVTASGQYQLHADPSSLKSGPKPGHSMLMCDYKEDDGSAVDLCPRTMLKTAAERARQRKVEPKFGFEIELVLVRYARSGNYELFDADGHAWSTSRALEHELVGKVLEPAIQQLDAAGVYVEMFHAESAKGQFEIVLPPASPVEAVDTLVFARQVLSACASAHGYRMTLHPKPFADACGTAAHAHISLASPDDDDDDDDDDDADADTVASRAVYESFYAGILSHLRAICAFTYSNLVSYERVQDGVWAGGTWVTWGTQNRETPLRKIEGSHWEVKCIDGLANPYLAMAALLVAGVNGMAKKERLVWGDCASDPATLLWEERLNLGINSNLPASIEEALVCLDKDEEISALLGHDLVQRYIAVKKAETRLLKGMDPKARKKWIMDRY
ncbi:hypothetical protein EsDP_00004502 [Epichloe bromicola]|uniref:Glutamine synthetase n=1 Tax=Epichloe bromicola TaxID=79588 RepID=A0ABQ0CRW7_9HYPO